MSDEHADDRYAELPRGPRPRKDDERAEGYAELPRGPRPRVGRDDEHPDEGDADFPDVLLIDGRVECPHCGVPSDSIKCYTTLLVVFLWFFAWWQPRKEVGCPSCVRGKIAALTAINLLTANLLWPILILPWSLILFCVSFTKGHSTEIQTILNDPRPR